MSPGCAWSSGITLDNVLIDGRSAGAGATVSTDARDSNITIKNSELTNCGDGSRCIDPAANGLQILANRFHDCLDCDFIRGAGSNVLIQRNTFDRALPGACQGGPSSCNHNDHIQIMGGGPWTVVGNRFGDVVGGAGSIFVSTGINNHGNGIHDVLIASNVLMSETAGFFGMQINSGGSPQRVSIVNNTVLSGSASALRLSSGWADVPLDQRPLVANNILGHSNGSECLGQTSDNLVEQGKGCSGEQRGPANLDATGAPTNASTLVIGRGDPTYAPQTDFYGHTRKSPPDIGAIEFGVQTPLGLTAPRRMTLSRTILRKHRWKVRVDLRLEGVDRLRTRLLTGTQQFLSLTSAVGGATRTTVTIVLPPRARPFSAFRLEFVGTAPDGRIVRQTTQLVIRA